MSRWFRILVAAMLTSCVSTSGPEPGTAPAVVVESAGQLALQPADASTAELLREFRARTRDGRLLAAERLARRFPERLAPAFADPNVEPELRERFARLAASRDEAWALLASSSANASDWTAALAQGVAAVSGRSLLCDAEFLERALAARPPGAELPADLAPALQALEHAFHIRWPGRPEDGEAALWLLAAEQRRLRGEASLALSDASRAREVAGSPEVATICVLGLARALAQTGRAGEASALAVGVAADDDPEASAAAHLLVGAIELDSARPARARAFLEQATSRSPRLAAAGSGQALLGLALLALGEEESGLATLSLARRALLAAGRDEEFAACTRNEIAYLAARGRGAEARVLERILDEFDRQPSLTP